MMLNHSTLDKLSQLKLTGMVRAWKEQIMLPEAVVMPFEERLSLLVGRELTEQDNRRMQLRLKQARLKQPAAIDDLDFKTPCGRVLR